MRSGGIILCGVAAAMLPLLAVQAAAPGASGNPYSSIVERNVFGLVPIPVVQPHQGPPPEPPPKIVPNGIMTVLGELQVLFKVEAPAKRGHPAENKSYMMTQGERQDDIEVVKIDKDTSTITFNNHGQVQELPLQKASDIGPAPGPAHGAPPNHGGIHPPNRPTPPRPGGGRPSFGRSLGARVEQSGDDTSSSGNNFASTSGDNTVAPAEKSKPEKLTPEAQIIMIEAQRAKMLDEGNPTAKIMPPTPLTSEVTGKPSAFDQANQRK